MKGNVPTATHAEEMSAENVDLFDVIDERAIGGRDVRDLPPKYFMSPQIIGSTIAFALGVASQLASLTMISNALLEYINPDLGPSPNALWIGTAIPLGQSIAFPIYGRFSDIFGRRWFFIFGNTLALVGFLLGGQSKNIPTSIAASTIIGFGGAGQYLGAIVPGELFPNKYRYIVFMVCSIGAFPLVALGPGLARELCINTTLSWRWIYHIYAIMCFISIVLLFFCYHPPAFHRLHKSGTKLDALKRMDWLGMIIYIGSAVSLLLGLTWGSGVYSWSSAKVIVPTLMGFVGFGLQALWDRFGKPRYPFMSSKLFLNRNWTLLTIIAALGAVPYYALILLFPQQLTLVIHASPSTAGWATCVLSGGITGGCLLQGIFTPHRLEKVGITIQLVLIVTCAVFTAFLGAMAVPDLTLGKAIAFGLVALLAQGWFESVAVSGASLELDPKDIGQANGTQMSVRTITGSVASAIYVTTLNNKLSENVARYVPAAIMKAGASAPVAEALTIAISMGNATAIAQSGASPAAIRAGSDAMQVALVKSYQLLYYIALAFGLTITIAGFFVNSKLLQSRLTTEIPRRLQDVGVKKIDVEVASSGGDGASEKM